jgi:acyl-CoA synthetase (AMP-forming)/AMP-acid ligase II
VRHYDSDHRTVGRVLADKAETIGARPFLGFEGRVISYAQLEEMTNRYARGFAGLGIGAGDHVAIMMPNCPEFLFALWGLGKLGAVAVPLNTSAKGELLSYFLAQSDSTALCVAEPLLERAGAALAGVPAVSRILVQGGRSAAAVPVPSELGEDDVIVYVVRAPGATVTYRELIEFCIDQMAYYMVPRYLSFIDELPKTPSEKVEKYKLKVAAAQSRAELWDRERAGITVWR